VFRTWDSPTLVSDFVLRWALAHGVAKIRDQAHRYLATGDADPSGPLAELAAANGALDFFCINDTTDDAHGHDPRLSQVQAALQRMFPLASPFEQQQPGVGHTQHPGAPHSWAHPTRLVEKPGHRPQPEPAR
jgi:hypothetical protein